MKEIKEGNESESGQCYFRWDIREDLSEEVAFQLKPEG